MHKIKKRMLIIALIIFLCTFVAAIAVASCGAPESAYTSNQPSLKSELQVVFDENGPNNLERNLQIAVDKNNNVACYYYNNNMVCLYLGQ